MEERTVFKGSPRQPSRGISIKYESPTLAYIKAKPPRPVTVEDIQEERRQRTLSAVGACNPWSLMDDSDEWIPTTPSRPARNTLTKPTPRSKREGIVLSETIALEAGWSSGRRHRRAPGQVAYATFRTETTAPLKPKVETSSVTSPKSRAWRLAFASVEEDVFKGWTPGSRSTLSASSSRPPGSAKLSKESQGSNKHPNGQKTQNEALPPGVRSKLAPPSKAHHWPSNKEFSSGQGAALWSRTGH